MQPGDLDHRRREIERGDTRAGARQAFREQPAATTDVGDAPSLQRRAFRDERQPHRVQPVQRAELAALVPEAVGGGVELGDLGRVHLCAGIHRDSPSPILADHWRAASATRSPSTRQSCPPARCARPAIQASVTSRELPS